MDISGEPILITGAGGFIGSHLVERCVQAGANVRALVHYNSQNRWGWLDSLHPEALAAVEVVIGDIRDPNGVRNTVRGVSTVFHLAALIGIPYSYHSPDAYVDTNIKGTLQLLRET